MNSPFFKRIGLWSVFFKWAGLVPSAFKTKVFLRICSRFYWNTRFSRRRPLVTNLGISDRYRVTLSSDAEAHYLFGRPDLYTGEVGALYLARHLLSQCDCFIDIGCYRGYFLFFIRNGLEEGSPIYYFEPNSALYDEIAQNVRCNGLQNIVGFNAAVGASNGVAKFYIDPKKPQQSSLNCNYLKGERVKEVEVEVISFDRFVTQHKLSNLCVKVDVEEAEFDFLKGASSEFARISYLIIEILSPAMKKGFVNILRREFGMEAYYIKGFELEYVPDGKLPSYVNREFNWLFCRKLPDELRRVLVATPFSINSPKPLL